MPTSKSTNHGMLRRRITTFFSLAFVVVVIDVALCLALEPFGAHSELVWTEYRATRDVDTILTGASYTAYGLNPRMFDTTLGAHTFNMATPGQSLQDTLTTIRSVSEEHKLDRVVLNLGYYSVSSYPRINSSIMFTQSKCLGESPIQVLSDVGSLVFNEHYFGKILSLSCAFPWCYDHVDHTPKAIRDNINNRLKGDVFAAGAQYSKVAGESWVYEGQGYGGIHHTRSEQSVPGQVLIDNLEMPFYEPNIRSFTQICKLCKDKGIPLYVVASPHSPSVVAEYGDRYWADMPRLEAIAKEAGATYMDFNLLHRDVLDLDPTSYTDYTHTNVEGSEKLSATLAQLIGRVESGEDVSGLFYGYDSQGRSAYWDSIYFVDSVDYTSKPADGGVLVSASAVTGTNTPVAYRYEVLNKTSGKYEVLRDYSADPNCLIPTTNSEPVTFRLYVRPTNGRQDTPRWLEGTVRS